MEILKSIWSWLGDFSLFLWLIPAIIAVGVFVRYCWKYIKSQWRFGKNLRRQVYFLKTSESKNLQTQRDKVKGLKLFNIENDIKDISQGLDVLQNLKDNSVYIVGYSSNYDFDSLIDLAKAKKIPVIIFANAGEIQDWSSFTGYIYCDVANTTNRVAVILVNIMQVV